MGYAAQGEIVYARNGALLEQFLDHCFSPSTDRSISRVLDLPSESEYGQSILRYEKSEVLLANEIRPSQCMEVLNTPLDAKAPRHLALKERSLSGDMDVGNLSKEFLHRLREDLADNLGNKYQVLEKLLSTL